MSSRLGGFALLWTLLAMGCGLSEAEDAAARVAVRRAELQSARARWESVGVDQYSLAIRPDGGTRCPPLLVFVADGEVTRIESHPDWTGELEPESIEEILGACARTIPQLFQILESHVESAERWNVVYDRILGYPISASIDPEVGQADEEVGWQIASLRET